MSWKRKGGLSDLLIRIPHLREVAHLLCRLSLSGLYRDRQFQRKIEQDRLTDDGCPHEEPDHGQ